MTRIKIDTLEEAFDHIDSMVKRGVPYLYANNIEDVKLDIINHFANATPDQELLLVEIDGSFVFSTKN